MKSEKRKPKKPYVPPAGSITLDARIIGPDADKLWDHLIAVSYQLLYINEWFRRIPKEHRHVTRAEVDTMFATIKTAMAARRLARAKS
jgi:hypothetical protein